MARYAPGEVNLVVKYSLFGYNILLWTAGVILFSIGIYAFTVKNLFDQIATVSSLPIDPAGLFIIAASVIVLVSMLGCMGALRENAFLLHYFSICVGITIVVGLTLGILGYVYGDWFSLEFAKLVNRTIKFYREDNDLQNIIDFTQSYFECCGGSGPDDWENNIYFNCSSSVFLNGVKYTPLEACGVPFSCCVEETSKSGITNTQCGFAIRGPSVDAFTRAEVIHTLGCRQALKDWITLNKNTLSGLLIGLAFSQMVVLLLAQNLLIAIREIALEHTKAKSKEALKLQQMSRKNLVDNAY